MRRLSRLVGLAGLLPRWAVSRWILAQAAQHVDQPNRRRIGRALHVALMAQPPAAGGSRHGQQAHETQIHDHDWVFRQVFLYELGGLAHFVEQVAPPDLLAGADRIEEWVQAPLAGYRYLAASGGVLTWERLGTAGTAGTVETIDIGSATLLEPGDCAIGRVVPTDQGMLFESAPLRVPADAAALVSEDPARWVEAVAAAARQTDEDGNAACYTGGHDFDLLTDVPVLVQDMLVLAAADRRGDRRDHTPAGKLALETRFVLDALRGDLDDVDGASPWPTVAEKLLDNMVRNAVTAALTPADRPRLLRLARKLGGPAVTVCLELAAPLAEAG
jgi:hypothetical protein